MKIRKFAPTDSKVTLEMTPMIDVVFQLLIFFMFTFKIVSVEGEFAITMPAAVQGSAAPSSENVTALPDIDVRLLASENGELAGIRVGEEQVSSMDELTATLQAIVGDDPQIASDVEMRIDAPPNLKYGAVVGAINAAARVRIQKIKFNPPPGS
jgi:biopolymer transport protein ExbD